MVHGSSRLSILTLMNLKVFLLKLQIPQKGTDTLAGELCDGTAYVQYGNGAGIIRPEDFA